MSTFRDALLSCPRCGHARTVTVAESLNGPRVPDAVRAILDDRFQRFVCPSCRATVEGDFPLVFLDFDAGIWIQHYPRAFESDWARYEAETRSTWRTNMSEHASGLVREWGERFKLRTVFGLRALRDKLGCFLHGLDDVQLEVLKLDLLRRQRELPFHPSSRLALWKVETGILTFDVEHAGRDGGTEPAGHFEVPRKALQSIGEDPLAWNDAITAVSGGPYTDVGRLMAPSGVRG